MKPEVIWDLFLQLQDCTVTAAQCNQQGAQGQKTFRFNCNSLGTVISAAQMNSGAPFGARP